MYAAPYFPYISYCCCYKLTDQLQILYLLHLLWKKNKRRWNRPHLFMKLLTSFPGQLPFFVQFRSNYFAKPLKLKTAFKLHLDFSI